MEVSHKHPLKRTSSPLVGFTACSGCQLGIFGGKVYYKCNTCPYFLHQVCYNMPEKVAHHPSDPNHQFTLHSRPTPLRTSNCKACGHRIIGFYYTCAICGDYYHIFCLAVPIAVKMPSHPHRLRLEFSPPYDFECDLCRKPSFNGWLYRCGLCEFDAHLACAMTHQGAQWLQNQSMPLQVDPKLPCESPGHELMELITRGMKGTDKYLPRQDGFSPCSPFSEDLTITSYQFSDACFSIDFARSLLGDEHLDEEGRIRGMENVAQAKAMTNQSNAVLANGIVGPPIQANQRIPLPIARKPGFEIHSRGVSPRNVLHFPFSPVIGSHIWSELAKEKAKRKANGTGGNREDRESTDSGPILSILRAPTNIKHFL
ncbi:hypothetical protein NMG60_11001856 [Bertholletia excelsa]